MKYKKGTRVKLTAYARECGLFKWRKYKGELTGVISGKSHDPTMVIVTRDGLITKERYHMDFWEKIG